MKLQISSLSRRSFSPSFKWCINQGSCKRNHNLKVRRLSFEFEGVVIYLTPWDVGRFFQTVWSSTWCGRLLPGCHGSPNLHHGSLLVLPLEDYHKHQLAAPAYHGKIINQTNKNIVILFFTISRSITNKDHCYHHFHTFNIQQADRVRG